MRIDWKIFFPSAGFATLIPWFFSKSTISSNMAYIMAKHGLKVGICDADIGLANLDVMFNVKIQKNIL